VRSCDETDPQVSVHWEGINCAVSVWCILIQLCPTARDEFSTFFAAAYITRPCPSTLKHSTNIPAFSIRLRVPQRVVRGTGEMGETKVDTTSKATFGNVAGPLRGRHLHRLRYRSGWRQPCWARQTVSTARGPAERHDAVFLACQRCHVRYAVTWLPAALSGSSSM
jgi:hypothetical protein